MTRSHLVTKALTGCLGIGLVVLGGCAPSKQQFRSSFLPPAPPPLGSPDPEPFLRAPSIPISNFVRELPKLPLELPVARGSAIDDRLRRADEAFESGRRAYAEGRQEEARKYFDAAIDVLLRAPENAPDRAKLERRLDQLVELIYRMDVNGLGSGEDADKVVFDKSPLDEILEMTFTIDPRLKPKVKDEIQATVSQLPLEESDAVLSYVNFFSSERGKRMISAGLRRAGRYRQMIERVLTEEGVPVELIYLAQAESAFLPRAMSYKAAGGMWQFLTWRGREYGLQITPFADERFDPEKATRAAARHLRDLFKQFGDWYLAMAAYNCGPGCVDRAVQRSGYADFWTLSRLNLLPKQTQNYVPVIVAITIVAKNAKDYGLDGIQVDPPIVYDSVTLDSPTNLMLVADALERPIAEIRELNPGLLKSTAPASYELRVPKGSAHSLIAALDAVPPARRASWRMHRVERGETIATIAKQYRTQPAAIVAANHSVASELESGDVLLIPASFQETSVAPKKSTVATRSKTAKRKTAVRNASQQRVSSKVVNRKARARNTRTASINMPSSTQ
jgi:membrane-bound lytic murein transglycosylase D